MFKNPIILNFSSKKVLGCLCFSGIVKIQYFKVAVHVVLNRLVPSVHYLRSHILKKLTTESCRFLYVGEAF